MKKAEREKFEGDLRKIDLEIEDRKKDIEDSPQYKEIFIEQQRVRKEEYENRKKVDSLKNKIYGKYVIKRSYRWNLTAKNIKHSVKQGIKRGLGVKNLGYVGEQNIPSIVHRLIREDYKASEMDKLLTEMNELGKRSGELYDKKQIIKKEGVKPLIAKQREILKKLNATELLAQKKKEKKTRKIDKLLKENPSEIMDKVRKEVRKGLILDALE